VYLKRLEGLVASVPLAANPDSTIFGNGDAGTVRGLELLLTREIKDGWGLRVAYTLQSAEATATSAFLLRRLITVDPLTHDTTFPAKAEFPLDYDRRHSLTAILQGQISPTAGPHLLGVNPLGGLEAAAIFRYNSGLPFSTVDSTGQIAGPPNDARLPANSTVDLLVRRPIRLGGFDGSIYFDARNLLNRRNIVAVRRDNGAVQPDNTTLDQIATDAYSRHPEPIPYESPRYRSWADLNDDGYIAGQDELMPLYQAAARDFTQPIFFYGPPRQARIGMELLF
jgi:outer membrane receptor protein involved in Fe transport